MRVEEWEVQEVEQEVENRVEEYQVEQVEVEVEQVLLFLASEIVQALRYLTADPQRP